MWGCDRVTLDDEDVVAGALGHMTVAIEHQGLVHARLERFHFCHDVVEVIEPFDLRVEARDWNSRATCYDDRHALVIQRLWIQRDRGCNDDRLWCTARKWVESECADSAGIDHANIAVLDLVGFHRFADGLLKLVKRVGRFEMQTLGRAVHTDEVGAEFEDPAVVDPNALEAAVAIKQTVIQDAHGGLFHRNEASVYPDLSGQWKGTCCGGGWRRKRRLVGHGTLKLL